MHLVFDARHISNPFTGLGRYTASLLSALALTSDKNKLKLTTLVNDAEEPGSNPLLEQMQALACKGLLTIQTTNIQPFTPAHHHSIGSLVTKLRADHYFYPHFDAPISVRAPTTFVIHDVIPLVVDGYILHWAMVKKAYFRLAMWASLARCDQCFAVSKTTRDDVSRLSGGLWDKKLDFAYEGPFSANVAPRGLKPSDMGMGISRRFLLYVGDRRPHKQLKRLINIFRLLRDVHGYDGQLVMAGSKENFDFDVEAFVSGDTSIVALGNVSDETLSSLYQHTEGLCLLSSYEGFGLPVVEAIYHQQRVIVSDGGALQELAPPGACRIPNDLSEPDAALRLAEHLARPTNTDHYQALIKAYSWEQASRKIFPYAY